MKINNNKIVSTLLIIYFACNIMPAGAFGLKLKPIKVDSAAKEKVKATAESGTKESGTKIKLKAKKEAKIDKIMDETVEKSVIKEEYTSGTPVIQDEKVSDDRNLVIEGSVEKSLDVNLSDCLKLALGNNPRIKAALNDAMASHTRIAQTWSNFFPQLQWGSSYSKMRNLQTAAMLGGQANDFNYYLLGQVTLNQMLYDFGVTQNMVTIKKLDYEGYKTSLTAVVNDVIYQTKDAYYNLLLAYENHKVAKDTVKKYEMFYNQASAFYEIGLNPKVDVMIAQVNLSDAKLKLIQAENGIDLAVAKLNNTMGVPYLNKYNVQERLKFHPIKLTMVDAFELAKQSRPELKLAEIKIEEANQAVKLAKKSFYPVLSAQGSYSRGGDSWNGGYGFNYGVYLNFQTVNGLLINNQIKEAKSLYDKQLADAQSTKNNIYLEIQQAYLAMYEKKNQIPVSLTQVKQAKENYDLSYGRYKVGVGNPTELKDAENSYQSSQLNYYKSLYEYNSAKAALEKAIGKNIIGEDEDHIELEK